MSLFGMSTEALLRLLAPHAQKWANVPAAPQRNQSKRQTWNRLDAMEYLWDDEARIHLSSIETVVDCATGMAVEFAADARGIDWYRVPRQLEWRLNLWALMRSNPEMRRGHGGVPDWDPSDFWAPIGRREEWQRRVACRPLPGLPTEADSDADGANIPAMR